MKYPVEEFEIKNPSYNQYEVADEVKFCLESALEDLNVTVEVPSSSPIPGFYPDNIRINKLSYMVIEEFDLPLIRTWYKYGQYEPYEALRADRLNSNTLTEENKVVYDPPYRSPVTRRALFDYFRDHEQLINEIWELDLYDFMDFNYGRYAPDNLKDLYLSNVRVFRTLDAFFNDSYDHEKDFSQFKSGLMDLQYEMGRHFQESVSKPIEEFLFHLEDAVAMFENIENVSKQQKELLKQAQIIYHAFIWKVPSLQIAIENTSGPDEDIQSYQSQLREYVGPSKRTYKKVIDNWKRNARRCNLIPKRTLNSSTYPEYTEIGKFGRIAASIGKDGRR